MEQERWILTLENDGGESKRPLAIGVRRLLKELLRHHQLRCVDIRAEMTNEAQRILQKCETSLMREHGGRRAGVGHTTARKMRTD